MHPKHDCIHCSLEGKTYNLLGFPLGNTTRSACSKLNSFCMNKYHCYHPFSHENGASSVIFSIKKVSKKHENDCTLNAAITICMNRNWWFSHSYSVIWGGALRDQICVNVPGNHFQKCSMRYVWFRESYTTIQVSYDRGVERKPVLTHIIPSRDWVPEKMYRNWKP